MCVDTTDADLAQTVLDTYGIVLIWNPSTEAAQLKAAKAHLAKAHKHLAVTRAATATTDSDTSTGSAPAPTVKSDSGKITDTQSASANYVTGEIFEFQKYKGASQVFTTTHSASCRKYDFNVKDLNSAWPGEFIWSAHVEANDIESFKPGPYCSMKFYFDEDLKGSVYGPYSTDHTDMSWMDDEEGSFSMI